MTDEQLDKARHSAAHMLNAAMQELYPGIKPAIGPTIENGFYYDFEPPEGVTISETDLPKIIKWMKRIIQQKHEFVGRAVSADEARKEFADQPYKLELIDALEKEGSEITLYDSGPLTDLCRGGHADNTSEIPIAGLALQKVAGAYWRGDEKNKMLTRVYGLLFATKEELDAHTAMLDEAAKRDHRKLGKELDLFTFSELVGPGLPLWTPRGTLVRNLLDDYVWQLRQGRGYDKVEIPHITKKDLYEKSGHWDKYADDLFRIKTREDHEYAMKPMNCPHHTQIYDRKQHSYRELPQRYASTTMVYRDEQTGELHGLSRVLSITQDDAHVFCRETQLKEEADKIWDIVDAFYKGVGFGELEVRLSLHDPENFENYLGDKETWDHMESQLRELISDRGVDAIEVPGEAAFYGPKIDFVTKDSIGREWQVATIQIDRNQPNSFDLTCINEKGEEERIVMIHAAIMGSIERFMSILIEHHAGAFPLWLSPTQIQIVTVSENHVDFGRELADEFAAAGLRADVDDADETVGKKIRNAIGQKAPYLLVIGDKEMGSDELMVRKRGEQDAESISKVKFIEECTKRVSEKSGDL